MLLLFAFVFSRFLCCIVYCVAVFDEKMLNDYIRRYYAIWTQKLRKTGFSSGADSIGNEGHVPPLLQMAGHWGTVSRRTANKKLNYLCWPPRKRSPKLCLQSQKSGGARQKDFPRQTYAPTLKFVPAPLGVFNRRLPNFFLGSTQVENINQTLISRRDYHQHLSMNADVHPVFDYITACTNSSPFLFNLRRSVIIRRMCCRPAPGALRTFSRPVYHFRLLFHPVAQWRLYTRPRQDKWPGWKIHPPPWLRHVYCSASVIVWTHNKNVTASDRFICFILIGKQLFTFHHAARSVGAM